jgi:hypothetical protein
MEAIPNPRCRKKQIVSFSRQERAAEPVEMRQETGTMAHSATPPRFTVSKFAAFLGLEEGVIRKRIAGGNGHQEYYSIGELAERWRVSRGTICNRLHTDVTTDGAHFLNS